MKFALASHGSRGDVEPCAAVGRELLRRGHEVCMAVPPDLVEFVESAGLPAVPYGLDTQAALDAYRSLWTNAFHNFWKVQDLVKLWREVLDTVTSSYENVSTTLKSLADGADLIFSGLVYEELAANVAEYYDVPFATLHFFPVRPNGHLHPLVPPPLLRSAMSANEWVSWRVMKKFEDAQRRDLRLAKAKSPSPTRLAHRGSLEMQAYDEVVFPRVAAEFSRSTCHRPFVGALTMELATTADDEVATWIADGKPPIYFGFGSTPVESPSETLSMISAACADLDERALICSGWSDFTSLSISEHVKVVPAVNFATTFPACRAVVHHGGAGTTAAALRAGVPSMILWTLPDQPIWAAQIKRMKVGDGRRFTHTTRETLVGDLSRILAPEYVSRAREIATRMSDPAASVVSAADLVEDFARRGRLG